MAENTIDEILVIGKAFANPLGGYSVFLGGSVGTTSAGGTVDISNEALANVI